MTFGHLNKKSNVEKLSVNDTEINDPQLIADEFNNFFTEIGSKISNSIEPTVTTPENYLNENPQVRNLDLGQTGPDRIRTVPCVTRTRCSRRTLLILT